MTVNHIVQIDSARQAVYDLSGERNHLLGELERKAARCIAMPARRKVVLMDVEDGRELLDRIEIVTAQLLRAVEEYNRLVAGMAGRAAKFRILEPEQRPEAVTGMENA